MVRVKLKDSENGDKDGICMKIKLNGGCGLLLFFFFLPVCVQALGTPTPDWPVHLQDLTAIAMTMGEQMKNIPRNTNKEDGNLDSREFMNEKNQEIITLRF